MCKSVLFLPNSQSTSDRLSVRSLYGGLAQQEPTDPSGIMERLRQRARKDDEVCYLGQYDNAAVGSAPFGSIARITITATDFENRTGVHMSVGQDPRSSSSFPN